MKRIPLGWLSLLFWIVYAAGAGLGFGIRSCSVNGRADEIKKIREDNQSTTIRHGTEVTLLTAAGGKASGPLADYFAKLKTVLDSPEFKDKNVAAVLTRAKQVKDVPEDLLVSLDPKKSWAGLRGIADNGVTPEVERLNKSYPLTDIMRGTKPVPAPELKLAPVPGPLRYWSPLFWFWFLLGSGAVFVALTVLIFSLDDSEYHSVRSYPWNRPLGLLYFAASAPVSVPAISVYGLVRLLSVDMKNGERWEALRKFAYRWRLVRRLPGPNVAPVVLPVTGHLRAAPAQAILPQAAAEAELQAEADGPSPQWYVVHPKVVLGLSHLLVENGIQLFPISIRQPTEMTGYAVPAASIDAFEETLRLAGVETEEKETDIELTERLVYSRKKGEIEVVGFEDKYRGKLDDILRSVSSYAGGIDLFIQPYDALTVRPRSEDGKVRIVYYGTPAPNPERRELKNAFGRAFPVGGLSAIAPDPERGVVISDVDGNHVAQVVGGTVYVLVSGLMSLALNGDWAAEALARLLHEAVAVAMAPMKIVEDDDVLSERWRQALEANREKYVELCSERFELAKAKLDDRIADAENEIVLAGKSITQHLQRRRDAEKERRVFIEKELPEWQDRLRREFEQLAASKCVTGVRCTGEGIEVRTRMVYIAWKGRRYLIGRFLIRLGDDGSVNIVNVANTARDTDYHHPHVRNSGDPCFGQMQEAIGKLMADRQYATVVNLLFRFFESYNLHGGVEEITKWKEVTGEEIQG